MTSSEHEVPPDFRDAVSELLYHSQMIEGLLRAYLSDVNEAADALLRDDGIRFKARAKDFQRPLSHLVRAFARHSDNVELLRRLKALEEHRNTAAHTAFLWAFVNRDKPELIAETLEKVRAHCAEARALVHLLTLETMNSYRLKTDPRSEKRQREPRQSE
jgi:hypothetical protein